MARVGRKGRSRKSTHPPDPITKPRRRILWRKTTTYRAVYKHPKVKDPIVVQSLNPQPKHRTFRAAGGLKKFTRKDYQSITRKVIIVGKTAKKGKKSTDLVDEDLEELEELEELDDLDDEDEPDDEDEEDEDDDEDEDEDGDDLDSLNVKQLRDKARELGIAVKGLKKDGLIDAIQNAPDEEDEDDEDDEDEEEDDEDDEDDEEDEDDVPPSKKSKKSKTSQASSKKAKKGSSSSGPSRSRTTDGKVGVQEVAEAAGTDARKLRMVLRKMGVEKDEDVGRYEWSSLNNAEVKKIIKAVKGGAVKEATKESLDKLKKSKSTDKASGKTTDAPRKKKSATGKKKRRSA